MHSYVCVCCCCVLVARNNPSTSNFRSFVLHLCANLQNLTAGGISEHSDLRPEAVDDVVDAHDANVALPPTSARGVALRLFVVRLLFRHAARVDERGELVRSWLELRSATQSFANSSPSSSSSTSPSSSSSSPSSPPSSSSSATTTSSSSCSSPCSSPCLRPTPGADRPFACLHLSGVADAGEVTRHWTRTLWTVVQQGPQLLRGAAQRSVWMQSLLTLLQLASAVDQAVANVAGDGATDAVAVIHHLSDICLLWRGDSACASLDPSLTELPALERRADPHQSTGVLHAAETGVSPPLHQAVDGANSPEPFSRAAPTLSMIRSAMTRVIGERNADQLANLTGVSARLRRGRDSPQVPALLLLLSLAVRCERFSGLLASARNERYSEGVVAVLVAPRWFSLSELFSHTLLSHSLTLLNCW
jgi:hypothetical protein